MSNYIKYLMLAAVVALASCGAEKTASEETKLQETKAPVETTENVIHLTSKQIETIGLELGGLSTMKVNGFVKASGTLGIPPNAYSSVTAKSSGIIIGSKKYVEGNYIKKGEVIAYIENPDFIIKQQDYLEAKAQLKLKKLEKARQQTLFDAAAGVSKSLENAEAELAILEAKTMSLAKQLSYLGISVEKLTPEGITQRIPLIAPMSGYISSIKMHNGMFAESSASLMEIVADDHLHLELDIFEKDIADIRVGQEISYTVPALGNQKYEGEVSVIGKEFNQETKTVRVHGHLHGQKPPFLKDLFINSQIWLDNKTVNALPEEAIFKDGENSYIYLSVANGTSDISDFKKHVVIPGSINNGFVAVEFLEELPAGTKIVTKGAYYVYAKSQSGDLASTH